VFLREAFSCPPKKKEEVRNAGKIRAYTWRVTSTRVYSAERGYAWHEYAVCVSRARQEWRQRRQFSPGALLSSSAPTCDIPLAPPARARPHARRGRYYGPKHTPPSRQWRSRAMDGNEARRDATLRSATRGRRRRRRRKRRRENGESARSLGSRRRGGSGSRHGGRRQPDGWEWARARARGGGRTGRGKEPCLPAVRPQCALRDITDRSCVCHSHVHTGTVRSTWLPRRWCCRRCRYRPPPRSARCRKALVHSRCAAAGSRKCARSILVSRADVKTVLAATGKKRGRGAISFSPFASRRSTRDISSLITKNKSARVKIPRRGLVSYGRARAPVGKHRQVRRERRSRRTERKKEGETVWSRAREISSSRGRFHVNKCLARASRRAKGARSGCGVCWLEEEERNRETAAREGRITRVTGRRLMALGDPRREEIGRGVVLCAVEE